MFAKAREVLTGFAARDTFQKTPDPAVFSLEKRNLEQLYAAQKKDVEKLDKILVHVMRQLEDAQRVHNQVGETRGLIAEFQRRASRKRDSAVAALAVEAEAARLMKKAAAVKNPSDRANRAVDPSLSSRGDGDVQRGGR